MQVLKLGLGTLLVQVKCRCGSILIEESERPRSYSRPGVFTGIDTVRPDFVFLTLGLGTTKNNLP